MGILFHRAAHGCQRLKHSCRPSYTLIVVLCCILSGALANPVITVRYSADPSAHIFPGDTRLWIYASHDHDDAEDMKTMSEYYVYSTHDLVHWQSYDRAFHLHNSSWAKSQLWAPDAAYVNGTYYLIYCAIERATNMFRTGLAISEQPQGPFTDIGFVQGVEWGQDPALYIDHDQTPYLYWGCGGRVLMAQLQPDLRAIVPGTLKELTETVTNFYEGAWVFDRNGVYYMMYAGQDEGTWGETLEYATAPHPTGPWAYGGILMETLDHYPDVGPSWTNHGSIAKYKGRWYIFYHTTALSNGHDKRRSVAIEYLTFGDDGSILAIEPTIQGVKEITVNSTKHHNKGPVHHPSLGRHHTAHSTAQANAHQAGELIPPGFVSQDGGVSSIEGSADPGAHDAAMLQHGHVAADSAAEARHAHHHQRESGGETAQHHHRHHQY